jgi:hypothetical protein
MLSTVRCYRPLEFHNVVHVGSFILSHMFHMGPLGDVTLELGLEVWR